MGESAPRLKRGMFGYSPQSVRMLIADRDTVFVRAQERLRMTELKVSELETELETAGEELREVRERADKVEAAEGRVAELETEVSTAREELLQLEVLRERADRMDVAESRVVMLESELDAAREDLQRRAERAESDEAKIVRLEIDLDAAREELARSLERSSELASSDVGDLSSILGTAETAFTKMIERARRSSEEQLARTERLRLEMQGEIDLLAAWRDRVQPLIASIQTSVGDASAQISQVPELIRSALAPMTDAIGAVSTGLAALAEASAAPSATKPSPESEASFGGRIIDLERKSEDQQAGEGEEPGVIRGPGAGDTGGYRGFTRWGNRRM